MYSSFDDIASGKAYRAQSSQGIKVSSLPLLPYMPRIAQIAEATDRRILNTNPRDDFMSLLIKKVEQGEMDHEELTAHASTLTLVSPPE